MRHAHAPASKVGRIARARMRNAWVAYHAGAPWMLPRGYEDMLSGSIGVAHKCVDENARLTAEVERLRKRWDKALHFIDYCADTLEDASVTLHALAREDGAS